MVASWLRVRERTALIFMSCSDVEGEVVEAQHICSYWRPTLGYGLFGVFVLFSDILVFTT